MTAERQTRLELYAGTGHPCPYLEQRESVLHFVDPRARLDPHLLAALLAQGFRRSGSFVYRAACPDCRECIAARIPVADLTPDRSQRRSVQRNEDLQLEVSASTITDEHFALYRRYINARHPGAGMGDPTPEDCRGFLLADWCTTRFLDLRLEGRLVATAVTDLVPGALSAVYTFFEPELSRRSLGTFAVMTQAAFARRHDLDHLYLGYWVEDAPKMEYKARFRPLELFRDGEWQFRKTPAT